MPPFCACTCHRHALGDVRWLQHGGHYMTAFGVAQMAKDLPEETADITDPVEAVSACPRCQGLHAAALRGLP